ncbi:hypothetical protein [Gordonia hongkongensis]|uniref:hypothetical protein n=1 Tax=Gordonia hongkongensis TaxID=1701090 RepID=UPI003D71FEA1
MNRRERRNAARRSRQQFIVADPESLANIAISCPDCNSDTEHWTDALGLPHITIRHDDTCPVWRSMQ